MFAITCIDLEIGDRFWALCFTSKNIWRIALDWTKGNMISLGNKFYPFGHFRCTKNLWFTSPEPIVSQTVEAYVLLRAIFYGDSAVRRSALWKTKPAWHFGWGKNIYLPHQQIWKDPGSKCCTMHTLVIWIGSAYLSGTFAQILKKVTFRLYEKSNPD